MWTLANATINDSAKLGTVKITDNDPQPALTMANEAEDEGTASNGEIVFTPTLSTESGRDVIVTYYTAPSGTFPVNADDYTAIMEADPANAVEATTITISAGDTTPSPAIEITTTADGDSEPDETFTLHYSADFATVATPMATGTIENDDPRTIAINSVDIAEDGGSAELIVTISPAPDTTSGPIEVTYTLSTTSAGEDDYTHTPAPLNFQVGEEQKTITIAIDEDPLNEGNETITVQLANAVSIDLFDGGAGTITILDNDNTLPTIGFVMAAQPVQEGTGANVDPAIMVELTDGSGNATPSGRRVTVDFAIAAGSAKTPADFALATGATTTVTFEPGQTSKALPIEIKPDNNDEGDEEFTITLSSPNNANLGMKSSTITIQDNDDAPVASIDEEELVTETDAELDGAITVSLTAASGKTVTVPYTVTAGTATSADYTLAAGDVVFTPNTTTGITPMTMDIPFKIAGDTLDEGEEQFTITAGWCNSCQCNDK